MLASDSLLAQTGRHPPRDQAFHLLPKSWLTEPSSRVLANLPAKLALPGSSATVSACAPPAVFALVVSQEPALLEGSAGSCSGRFLPADWLKPHFAAALLHQIKLVRSYVLKYLVSSTRPGNLDALRDTILPQTKIGTQICER
jgi:hypothetical protein